jgi:peptidoglycan/xylan/chitin deacetylase (PgdA/CDA1 family)/SAM-dependent methyltransferase
MATALATRRAPAGPLDPQPEGPSGTALATARPAEISVVVPAFNAEATIEAALASLAAQSFTAFEALVVDDGSSDATAAIVARVAAADPRIRLLRQATNRGASAARNAGLRAAAAPFVLFLDADDWLGPDHLARLHAALAAAPEAVAAYCHYTPVLADGSLGPVEPAPEPAALFAHAAHSCPIAIHACLVRRDAVAALGGFDESLAVGEDWDLWQRLARIGAPQVRVEMASAFYRGRAGSLSRCSPDALAACVAVMRRGHAADPRVDAAPQHWAGAPTSALPLALTRLLVWGVGARAGAGCDPADAVDLAGAAELSDLPAGEVATILVHGIAQSLACRRAELIRAWPELWEGCAPAVAALGRRMGQPRLAERAGEQAARQLGHEVAVAALPARIGPVCRIGLDLAEPWPALPIDRDAEIVQVAVTVGRRGLGTVELPSIGVDDPVSAVAQAIQDELGRPWMRQWLRWVLRRQPVLAGRIALQLLARPAARRMLAELVRAAPATRRDRALGWLAQQPRSVLPRRLRPPQPPLPPVVPAAAPAPEQAWDMVFVEEDPWGYDSAYEQTKYAHTLELLPDGPIDRVLELACAEGHFTLQLAPRVSRLLATDISTVALARAERRCRGCGNVDYRQLDLIRDPLPGEFDLIVCSEVLYFLKDLPAVWWLGRKLARHLPRGGHLLTAHAKVTGDGAAGAAFDWPVGFGARRIGRALGRVPELELVRELETELYLVQLFRRRAGALRRRPAPDRLRRPAAWPTDPTVASGIVTGTGRLPQREIVGRWRTATLPILMYHRIGATAPAGLEPYCLAAERFEAQLDWLRSAGYRTVSLAVWRWALRERNGSLPGKVVVLTFDDGYVDFATTAWPLLRKYGFGATLFVVTDHVGGVAEWDRAHGDPAPLLGWDELRRLAREGVEIGAHSASHPYLSRCSVREVVDEARRARGRLEAELGRPVKVMAYPYGDEDGLTRRAMAAAGFELAVTTRPGWARLGDDPMGLPRQEVRGADTLADFQAKLGQADRASLDWRLRHRLDRWLGRSPRW